MNGCVSCGHCFLDANHAKGREFPGRIIAQADFYDLLNIKAQYQTLVDLPGLTSLFPILGHRRPFRENL